MPIPYTGDPSSFHDPVDFPADGDDADEASIDLLQRVHDNTTYLKQEVEEGGVSINNRFDALAPLNFPYDTLNATLTATGHSFEIWDFAHSSVLNLYVALVLDRTSNQVQMWYSNHLKLWTKGEVAAMTDDIANLIVGDVLSLTAGFFQYNSVNLKIVKWVKGTGLTVTTTAIAGAGSIVTNPHSGEYFAGTYVWGLNDGSNNAIILTTTDLVTVGRQPFGVALDLNHIHGPMVCAKSSSILVMIGSAFQGFLKQNGSFFITSTDAITFTERTFPAVNPGLECFGGVGYNATQGKFVCASATMDSGGSHPTGPVNVYTSPDGINWSLLKTLANPDGASGQNYVSAVASQGNSILMTLTPNASSTAGPHTWLYSPDFGVHWFYFTKMQFTSTGTFFDELWSKLRGENGQYVFGNATRVMGSLTLGEQGVAVS